MRLNIHRTYMYSSQDLATRPPGRHVLMERSRHEVLQGQWHMVTPQRCWDIAV